MNRSLALLGALLLAAPSIASAQMVEEEEEADPLAATPEPEPPARAEPVPQPVTVTTSRGQTAQQPPRSTAPPAPVSSRSPYAVAAEEAADDEGEDEGDPYDFLWIELFGGVSYVDLRALGQNNFYPEIVRLSGTGPMGGAALGFRIEFISIGVRGTLAHYSDDFDVGTAVGEITLALPLPWVKPFIRVGFGLGWHGDSDFMAPASSQTTVFGFAFSGAIGFDVFFADWFAVGAAFSADILNMHRQSGDEPIGDPSMVVFAETGDAVGIQIRGHLAASFHF